MDIANQSRSWSKLRSAKRTRQQQEARIGLLFLAPWLIGFVLLKALPILAALIFSLTDFKMLSPETTKFVGLENYIRFFRDAAAGASLMFECQLSCEKSTISITMPSAAASVQTAFRRSTCSVRSAPSGW